MSFEYGSDTQEIKNPFKLEGTIYLLSGCLILLIGLISIFYLKKQVLVDKQAEGWINLIISLLLLTMAFNFIVRGLLKVFRFYTGRSIPTSLSNNVAKSEKHVHEPNTVYAPEELDQMLTGRKNITFAEPVTIFDRMIYSIFPKMIFLPYSMRNLLHTIIQNTGYSLIGVIVYLLAVLSGSLGLTSLSGTSYGNWLGMGLTLYLLLIWLLNPLGAKYINTRFLRLGKRSNIVWVVLVAILIPVLCELAIQNGLELPDAPLSTGWHSFAVFLLIAFLAVASIWISKVRSDMYDPITEVSEFREHWQENVHPKDFFRSLDMELASMRYKEIPNRVYRELAPSLQMEGNMDKGSFTGDTIQETQPVYREILFPAGFHHMRLYLTGIGHALIVVAAFLLFALNQNYSDGISFAGIFNGVFFPAILWLFGMGAVHTSHLYWAEMHFVSNLVQLQGEGTYTESKLSVGMAFSDSTRSENTVVRTSFSPWLLATKIVTSTIASSGTGNLAGPRFILSMHKAEDVSEHLVGKIREFLNTRENIAVSGSEQDRRNMEHIIQINEAAATKEGVILLNKKDRSLDNADHARKLLDSDQGDEE